MTVNVRQFWRRLRATFRRHAIDADMHEEFRLHVELETEHLMVTRGLTRPEAQRAAHVAFGGVSRFEERSREVRGIRSLEEFARDLRHSARLLVRSPLFAGVAVVTLALGTGAVSAMFSVLNSIVLQPLPYADADWLVAVHHVRPTEGGGEAGITGAAYHRYRTEGRAIRDLAVYHEQALNLKDEDGARRVQIANASPDLFRVLGVQTTLGRLYDESDWTGTSMDLTWTMPVLLSHDFWQGSFGGDSTVIGRVLSINDNPRQVVGVLPPGFAFPRRETQIWRMDVPPEPMGMGIVASGYSAIGRLAPGFSISEAQAEYAGVLARLETESAEYAPDREPELALVRPLKAVVLGDSRDVLWTVFGSVLLLLLVACANVANLFAVRAETRGREVAVRAALGAGRATLARLFLTESLLVSLAGAVLGLGFAYGAIQIIVALAPEQLPRVAEVSLDAWTLLFTASVSVAVALVLGLLSLLRHVRAAAMAPALRAVSGGTGSTRSHGRMLHGMIAAQVAMTLALLAGSALLIRSYERLMSVERGFTSAGVLTVEVGVPFRMADRHQQLYNEVANHMRAIPGVLAVGGVSALPMSGGGDEQPLRPVESRVASVEAQQPVAFRFMLPGYFESMDTPVLEGIGFAPGETTEHAHPVIVSEALARRLFPDGRALGRRLYRLDQDGEPVTMFDLETLQPGPLPPYTIAGIVANVTDDALQARGGEAIYIPVMAPRVEQSIMPVEMSFVLRTELPPLVIAAAARAAVHDVDPALSVARIRTMDEIVAAATSRERFLAIVLLIAAATSLLLGAVGIYGIAAWSVRRRAPEIGLRIALGARPPEVVFMVMRQALGVVVVGAIAGLMLTLAGTRFLQTLLYDVSPTDAGLLGSVTALIVAVAAGASFAPALRASRTDPTAALRAE